MWKRIKYNLIIICLISWERFNYKYQVFHKPTYKYERWKQILTPKHSKALLFQNIQIYRSRSLNKLPHFPGKSLISFHTKSGSYLEDYTPLKLYDFTVPMADLVEIYVLYIRSVLESSAVVWHSSLTEGQKLEIERVQRVALKIILKDDYSDYEDALEQCSLSMLSDRRDDLCLSFAKNCVKNPKTKDMFPVNVQSYNTRNPEKYFVTHANTGRLANSAIPYMQRLLNSI